MFITVVTLYQLIEGYNNNFIGLYVGWLLAYLNSVVAIWIIMRTFNAEYNKFMKLIFSSMIIRLFIMTFLILAGILWLKFEISYFVFTVFGFYIVYLIFEILFLNKKIVNI